MRTLIAVVLPMLLIGACSAKDEPGGGGGTPDGSAPPQGPGVKADDFDRACATEEDCIAISEGTDCCLPCPSAAIAKKAASAYNAALATHRSACKEVSCPAIGCAETRARCTSGRCEACSGPTCSADGGADSGPPPDGKLVVIPGASGTFEPAEVDIKVGDTVTWLFEEDGHSVASGGGGGADCTTDGKLASGPRVSGAVFTFKFDAPGDYAYHCVEHCAEPEGGVVRVR